MKTDIETLVSLNVKGTPPMSRKAVVADLKRAKASGASIICLQEMKWPWYWSALWEVFPKHLWGRAPGRFNLPGQSQVVLYRRDTWRRDGLDVRLAHKGYRLVTEARFFVAPRLVHIETEIGVRIRNTHLIAGAWSPPPRWPSLAWKASQKMRQGVWLPAVKKDRMLLERFVESGDPVINTGDYNDPRGFPLGKQVDGRPIHYVDQGGIDYVFVVDGDIAVVDVEGWSRISTSQLNTDHAGRGLRFRLREIKAQQAKPFEPKGK